MHLQADGTQAQLHTSWALLITERPAGAEAVANFLHQQTLCASFSAAQRLDGHAEAALQALLMLCASLELAQNSLFARLEPGSAMPVAGDTMLDLTFCITTPL